MPDSNPPSFRAGMSAADRIASPGMDSASAMRRSASAVELMRSKEMRLGFHMTKTPMGSTFQHVGSFTPMVDFHRPTMAVQGYTGPWRSVGAYYEWCAAQMKKNDSCVIRDDQRVSRFWPFGKDVVKVHGSFEDEHFFLATRNKTKQDELNDLHSAGSGRWAVTNAFVEKFSDPPPSRYPQSRFAK